MGPIKPRTLTLAKDFFRFRTNPTNCERIARARTRPPTLPGVFTRYIVTTAVNIGDFCGFTRNITRYIPSLEA